MRCGVRRLTKRPIEGRRELRRVGEDRHLLEAVLIQLIADGGDAAIHHVGGRNDIGARLGQRYSGLRQQVERGIVIDVELVAIPSHHAAVAVRGVLAQADVGDQHQLLRGRRLLQRAQALLRDARRS